MKLIGYKENYQLFSGKASDGARQLGFAGIALIWIFSGGRPASPRQPEQLRLPLALLVFALGLDLLQCTVQTIILSCFHRYHEKTRYIDEDPEKVAPPYLNWPGNTFFVLKLISVIAVYVLTSIYLWGQWVCK